MNADAAAIAAGLHVRIELSRPGARRHASAGPTGTKWSPGREHGFSLDVAFEAPAGITVVFGPSGSGKSTTLAAIAGLVRPTSGRIALGPHVWFDDSAGVDVPIQERRVAFVFQSLALFPHMTGRENVAYGMDRTIDREGRRAHALTLLARFHAAHVAERRPSTFSGGEAQRVALARALGMTPRVVLLDEPFSALDRELRRELFADVQTVARDLNVPILLVTHESGEAAALGERLVRLEGGRVVRGGRLA